MLIPLFIFIGLLIASFEIYSNSYNRFHTLVLGIYGVLIVAFITAMFYQPLSIELLSMNIAYLALRFAFMGIVKANPEKFIKFILDRLRDAGREAE